MREHQFNSVWSLISDFKFGTYLAPYVYLDGFILVLCDLGLHLEATHYRQNVSDIASSV